MKHTPGPWKYENDSQGFICDSSGSDVVADAWYSRDHEVQEANARLIAAAPELLECLIWAMEQGHLTYHARTKSNVAHCDAVDRARAAIAKATGE